MSDDELTASLLNLNRRIARLERILDVVAILTIIGAGLLLIGWI